MMIEAAANTAIAAGIDALIKRVSVDHNCAPVRTKLLENVIRIRTIFTFASPNKKIDISSKYVPLHIDYENQRTAVSQRSDLPRISKQSLLIGKAGQGKSYLMRHMAWQEIVINNRIVLYIEAKDVSEKRNLVAHLVNELSLYGMAITADETLNHIAAHLAEVGCIVYIDGIDELAASYRLEVIKDIELLARILPKDRLVVSSREDAGLERSSFFGTLRLSNLKNDEWKEIASTIVEDRDLLESLSVELKKPRSPYDMLMTPLLVTLLVVRYTERRLVPNKWIDFYSNLFDLLAERHDRIKFAFKREKISNYTNSQLERYFSAICFLVRKDSLVSPTRRQMLGLAKLASERVGAVSDPMAPLQDIVRLTSLIAEDGDQWNFVHKSVTEYYAALYVQQQETSFAERFYSYVKDNEYKWHVELEFLHEIDNYRFLRELIVPTLKRVLGNCHSLSGPGEKREWFRKWYAQFHVHVDLEPYASDRSWANDPASREEIIHSQADRWKFMEVQSHDDSTVRRMNTGMGLATDSKYHVGSRAEVGIPSYLGIAEGGRYWSERERFQKAVLETFGRHEFVTRLREKVGSPEWILKLVDYGDSIASYAFIDVSKMVECTEWNDDLLECISQHYSKYKEQYVLALGRVEEYVSMLEKDFEF